MKHDHWASNVWSVPAHARLRQLGLSLLRVAGGVLTQLNKVPTACM